MGGRRMNKQEIDAWLKDLDERHEKQLWKEGIKWKEDYHKSRLFFKGFDIKLKYTTK